MTVAEATPDFEQVDRNDRAFLGHPKGLGYLGFTEACERFSYYSMQTLLTLYMVNYLLLAGHIEKVTGLAWLRGWHYQGLEGQPLSSAIFGDYTSLVYLMPILGGANKMVGYVGGLYSSLPTTTFWLIHIASAAFGMVACVAFKVVLGKRMSG